MVVRIYDPKFPLDLSDLLDLRGGTVPLDVDERIVVLIDATDLLTNAAAKRVQVITLPGDISDAPGAVSASELWTHGDQRNVGAGGAGQFSGMGYTYQAIGAGEAVTQLQLVELRVRSDVAARLRFYYETVDVFGAETDLGNLATNLRSVSDATASNFGGVPWTATTPAPDAAIIPNHSARVTRLVFNIPANVDYSFLLGPAALFNRTIAAQTQAMGWGVWTQAVVTGISATYAVIVRKLPA